MKSLVVLLALAAATLALPGDAAAQSGPRSFPDGLTDRQKEEVRELLRTDGDIRWVFKELPILSRESRIAARAALAAWNLDRDKYMDFHTALMESRGGLSERDILRMAGNAGLDPEAIKAGSNDPAVEQALQRNSRLAERLGIRGTPGFIIGDQVVPGAIDLRTMRQMIKELRERS